MLSLINLWLSYFDAILIYNKNLDKHIEHLQSVLTILRKEKLYTNVISTLNTKLLRFKYIKYLYVNDPNFTNVFNACEKVTFGMFYRRDGFLLRENKLCVPNSALHELLVNEAYRGGLLGYFGITKSLDVFLKESFF